MNELIYIHLFPLGFDKNIGITTIQPTHTRAIGFPWDKKPYRRRAKIITIINIYLTDN